MFEEASGLEGVVADLSQIVVVGPDLVPGADGDAGGLAQLAECVDQHVVLVDVVGPRRRRAHEQVVVAEARRAGRHRLAPQHRAPQLPMQRSVWVCSDVASERTVRGMASQQLGGLG